MFSEAASIRTVISVWADQQIDTETPRYVVNSCPQSAFLRLTLLDF